MVQSNTGKETELVVQPKGVGDITSSALGSGARYNTGKHDRSLIPLGILARTFKEKSGFFLDANYVKAMELIGKFQVVSQDVDYLYQALQAINADWKHCADVFEYGKKKYKAWNWAKGMAWSICIACIGRHFEKIAGGEEIDAESGRPHIGHVMCNIVMLIHYTDFYRDGNDLYSLPPASPVSIKAANKLAESISQL